MFVLLDLAVNVDTMHQAVSHVSVAIRRALVHGPILAPQVVRTIDTLRWMHTSTSCRQSAADGAAERPMPPFRHADLLPNHKQLGYITDDPHPDRPPEGASHACLMSLALSVPSAFSACVLQMILPCVRRTLRFWPRIGPPQKTVKKY